MTLADRLQRHRRLFEQQGEPLGEASLKESTSAIPFSEFSEAPQEKNIFAPLEPSSAKEVIVTSLDPYEEPVFPSVLAGKVLPHKTMVEQTEIQRSRLYSQQMEEGGFL